MQEKETILVRTPFDTLIGTVKRSLQCHNGIDLYIVLNGIKCYVWQEYKSKRYVVYLAEDSNIDVNTLRGFKKGIAREKEVVQ